MFLYAFGGFSNIEPFCLHSAYLLSEMITLVLKTKIFFLHRVWSTLTI